jgi:LDH2 family malate/lactate/ureidoglycolate dehydrogenase
VRTPGEAGLRRRERALKDGVALHAAIMPQLATWADKLGVPLPPAHTA